VLLIDLVARTAKQARRNPVFLAWSLAHYERRHRLSNVTLASWLGLSPAHLASLALCRRPESQLPCFATDIHKLAAVSGCNGGRLTELLIEVEGDFGERGTPRPGS
jgi:hypothetical protein